MREQQKTVIEAQQQAADYRAYAYKYGIIFTNQADLNAKMIEIKEEQRRKNLARQQEKERILEERKQRIAQQSVSHSPSSAPVTQDTSPSPSITSCDISPSSSDSGTCGGGGGSTD